jgi:hypothetical protein
MKITPQARRRITGAVQALDPSLQNRWESWAAAGAASQIRTDVPYDIAEIALRALGAAEKEIYLRLEYDGLDEDTRADLANDLGYVLAIETSIRAEGVGH